MTPKIRNVIIFVTIAAVFVLIYIFFIKPSPNEPSLVSSASPTTATTTTANPNSLTIKDTKDFLSILLNVKNIKLDDAIFSFEAFNSLRDSSIVLTPDGTEGRPNPFAPLGVDNVAVPVNSSNTNSNTNTQIQPGVNTNPSNKIGPTTKP